MRSPALASFETMGTGAEVLATDPDRLPEALAAARTEAEATDRACSRFRADSDLCRVNAAAGSWVAVGPRFIEALLAALRVAELTDGDVDPTVGAALRALGYDRDFDAVAPTGPAALPVPAPGWRSVDLDARKSRVRVPPDTALDLGAGAKALAADRAARAAATAAGCGVLVSFGGDVAVAGAAPPGGWVVGLADRHGGRQARETVTIRDGGLATSSTTVRRWTRGGVTIHHVLDPRTGRSAPEVWRTVSAAAGSCGDANAATTASIVRGEAAPAWLERLGLPARLVRPGGEVVRTTGWPGEPA